MTPTPGTPSQPRPPLDGALGEYADFYDADVPADADPDHADDLRWMLVGRRIDSTVIDLRWMLVGGDTNPTVVDATIDDATVSITGLVAAYERGPSRDETARPPTTGHQEEPGRLSAKAAEKKEMADHIHKEHEGAWISENSSHVTDVYKIDPETGRSSLRDENGSLAHLTRSLQKSIIRTENRFKKNVDRLRLSRQHHH